MDSKAKLDKDADSLCELKTLSENVDATISEDDETDYTLSFNESTESYTLKEDVNSEFKSIDLDVPSSYKVEPVDFPKSPAELKFIRGMKLPIEERLAAADDDNSFYKTELMSNCQDVRLIGRATSSSRRKVISVSSDLLDVSRFDDDLKTDVESSFEDVSNGDLDLIVNENTDDEHTTIAGLESEVVELSQEQAANRQDRHVVSINGVEHTIDLRVIEPYKHVLAHGGFFPKYSSNSIIVIRASFLPDRKRSDYDYVMNNLFLYVYNILDTLISEDYFLIYLHGGSSRSCMPKCSFLKRCYQMVDRKLKKNLKGLYLVHPTFWLKTFFIIMRPFISSKFGKKLFYVNTLDELYSRIPLDESKIPERVKLYDELKKSKSF